MNIDIGLTGEDTVKGTLHNRPGFAEQLFYSKKKVIKITVRIF